MASKKLKGSTVIPLDVSPGSIISTFKNVNVGPDVTGGDDLATTARNTKTGRPDNAMGVYAAWPGCTPKYMRHRGPLANGDSLETMARMYVRIKGSSKSKHEARHASFMRSMPDQETRDVAGVLFGGSYVGENESKEGRRSKTLGQGYIDFILQQADHSVNEKFSVAEVLSDNYVSFFFGQQAPIFTYRGMLMNSYQDDWAMNMNRVFRSIARGTQLARRGLLLYLRYDSVLVSGALTAMSMSHRAESETGVPFTFQLLVKKMHIMYGALTTPTEIPTGSPFIHSSYILKETVINEIAPAVNKASTNEDATDVTDAPNAPTPEGTETNAVKDRRQDAEFATGATSGVQDPGPQDDPEVQPLQQSPGV